MIGPKPFCIVFDKVNGFIEDYDRTKYLVLFDLEKYDIIFDKIRYLIGLKGITNVCSYNFEKIKTDLDENLPLEKKLGC